MLDLQSILQDVAITFSIIMSIKGFLPKSLKDDVSLHEQRLQTLENRAAEDRQTCKEGMRHLNHKLDDINEYLRDHKGDC